MFQKVAEAEFLRGEHEILRFWAERRVFQRLREQNRGKPPWSFLDGPITANNPMGVHHAWGRTYKDAFQRYWAMNGRELRYQNGFDCQGLWVEVEVEKQLGLGAKTQIEAFGVDRFVNECKKRVLNYAAVQTEQSIRLGYWMDWDDPDQLRRLAESIGTDDEVTITTPSGKQEKGKADLLVGRLGNPDWRGSYFTFSTENNETIWAFLKKCFERGKVYRGYDVMPWSGRGGSAYSQMEVADGRRLTVHRSVFVRFPIRSKAGVRGQGSGVSESRGVPPRSGLAQPGSEPAATSHPFNLADPMPPESAPPELRQQNVPPSKDVYHSTRKETETALHPEAELRSQRSEVSDQKSDEPRLAATRQRSAPSLQSTDPESQTTHEYLLVWTTTPWTLTSNVAAAVNPDLEYVQLRTKRDGAIYYFAKENLDYQRLGREFKEGFGRPEWSWPDGVPKLKTISQIFKEQGGYEILGTLKGAEMIGWQYEGPFDDLPAQNTPGGVPAEPQRLDRSGITCHQVIDGGRDSKGNPNVVAGEGTGIVHIAPGCGDVDYQLGKERGLVSIAPLGEDGRFTESFGDFTGREAIDPATAELVFAKLREKHLLMSVEEYPHIYPHCWRTGDELVFRLVDEWFINMDWRDEIKEVVRQIRWLPESIQGQERELEWLTTMRDWMISKKRFWGLALPIWFEEYEQNGVRQVDFEVIGSLAELKERAVEGWEELERHTPHKPWIDRVKIRNPKTGRLMSRVPDVGNPWLDAGIVPFSTMGYNTDRDFWRKWYPADLVTECFPGQFRNWFYALLAMATMMDRTPPFRTLLGHRLVMNEEGKPMHKSDGTAIWFEEAAEQLGVDTMRWMYLAQNPAVDLRFGTRSPDQRVTLQTPNGPTDVTIDGVPTCLVKSTPADEIRRQVLIPLWNSYAFFVNYARLDEFDPHSPPVPVGERPEIDRWILSNLQALIDGMNRAFQNFDSPEACRLAAGFIDDLSNWYIRRNRRRFWRSRKVEGRESRDEGWTVGETLMAEWDRDKLAAYQTLYTVLVTLTKLLAPCIPFLTERMYQNLVSGGEETGDRRQETEEEVRGQRSEVSTDPRLAATRQRSAPPVAPDSVHLCAYPQPDPTLLDAELNRRMATAQLVVTLGHKLRDQANQRVRQPLAELRYSTSDAAMRGAIESLSEVIREELNVKQLTFADSLDELAKYTYKPNLKTLGPKYGKLLNVLRQKLPEYDPHALAPLRRGEMVTITLDGHEITLQPEDVMIGTEQATEWVVTDDRGLQVALSTQLTPELLREGMARDFVRHVQQMRKDLGLEIEDRIRVFHSTDDSEVQAAIREWNDFICGETLANEIRATAQSAVESKVVTVGEAKVAIGIERA